MIEPITFTIVMFSITSIGVIGVSMRQIKGIERPSTILQRKADNDTAHRLLDSRVSAHKKIEEIHNKTAIVTSSMDMANVRSSSVGDKRADQ